MTVSKDQFIAGWSVLSEAFKREPNEMVMIELHGALCELAPALTNQQFKYAVRQCLLNSKFMPSMSEVLGQIYEPDTRGMPGLPDIDPRYANEYELATYNKALNTRNEWLAKNSRTPAIGVFRKDRINAIPGAAPVGILTTEHRPPRQRVLSQQDQELELERRKRQMIREVS